MLSKLSFGATLLFSVIFHAFTAAQAVSGYNSQAIITTEIKLPVWSVFAYPTSIAAATSIKSSLPLSRITIVIAATTATSLDVVTTAVIGEAAVTSSAAIGRDEITPTAKTTNAAVLPVASTSQVAVNSFFSAATESVAASVQSQAYITKKSIPTVAPIPPTAPTAPNLTLPVPPLPFVANLTLVALVVVYGPVINLNSATAPNLTAAPVTAVLSTLNTSSFAALAATINPSALALDNVAAVSSAAAAWTSITSVLGNLSNAPAVYAATAATINVAFTGNGVAINNGAVQISAAVATMFGVTSPSVVSIIVVANTSTSASYVIMIISGTPIQKRDISSPSLVYFSKTLVPDPIAYQQQQIAAYITAVAANTAAVKQYEADLQAYNLAQAQYNDSLVVYAQQQQTYQIDLAAYKAAQAAMTSRVILPSILPTAQISTRSPGTGVATEPIVTRADNHNITMVLQTYQIDLAAYKTAQTAMTSRVMLPSVLPTAQISTRSPGTGVATKPIVAGADNLKFTMVLILHVSVLFIALL